jgi:pimeloyl-ACP methyl ester carboxylesterase
MSATSGRSWVGATRRQLLAGLAASVTVAVPGVAAPIRSPGLRERRGYADGPLGQTHYRELGEPGPAVLLLHETPWSSQQYAKVKPLIAAAGYRSIAPDTPGYGASPAPLAQPTLAEYAAQMIALLDALNIKSVTLAGDHTGAAIAIAMAARYPAKVDRIILYGVPLYSPEQRASRLAHFDERYAPPVVLREGGTHLSDRFTFVRGVMTGGTATLESAQAATLAFMTAEDRAARVLRAVFEHTAMADDLTSIRAPGLLLTSSKDSLHAGTLRARQIRPDFDFADLGEGGPHLVFDQPHLWWREVQPFLSRQRGK